MCEWYRAWVRCGCGLVPAYVYCVTTTICMEHTKNHIHTHKHACFHACTHTRTHTRTHTHTHTHITEDTQQNTHTQTHTHTTEHTQPYTHNKTHTHTTEHTRTHTHAGPMLGHPECAGHLHTRPGSLPPDPDTWHDEGCELGPGGAAV